MTKWALFSFIVAVAPATIIAIMAIKSKRRNKDKTTRPPHQITVNSHEWSKFSNIRKFVVVREVPDPVKGWEDRVSYEPVKEFYSKADADFYIQYQSTVNSWNGLHVREELLIKGERLVI